MFTLDFKCSFRYRGDEGVDKATEEKKILNSTSAFAIDRLLRDENSRILAWDICHEDFEKSKSAGSELNKRFIKMPFLSEAVTCYNSCEKKSHEQKIC